MYKCIKELTIHYTLLNGVCGSGCCGGLYNGEDNFTFEVNELYELDFWKYNDVQFFYQETGSYVSFSKDLLEEHFEYVNE